MGKQRANTLRTRNKEADESFYNERGFNLAVIMAYQLSILLPCLKQKKQLIIRPARQLIAAQIRQEAPYCVNF
jgi:hypothetical protein